MNGTLDWTGWPAKYAHWLPLWSWIWRLPQAINREERWDMIRAAQQEHLNDRHYLEEVWARR